MRINKKGGKKAPLQTIKALSVPKQESSKQSQYSTQPDINGSIIIGFRGKSATQSIVNLAQNEKTIIDQQQHLTQIKSMNSSQRNNLQKQLPPLDRQTSSTTDD